MPGAMTGIGAEAEAATVRDALASLREAGYFVWRGAIAPHSLAPLVDSARARYDVLEDLVARHAVEAARAYLPAGTRYQGSAASIGIDGPGLAALLAALPHRLWPLAEDLAGAGAVVDIDISWLRRQYPPSLRQPGHAPHALHQDGAFGHDFSCGGDRSGAALLSMLTLWIPLCEAGAGAPGLEFITESFHELVPLAELGDAYAEARWPVAARVRPVVAPGDLVLIAGHNLHRTHVTPAMTRARTSVEFRVVPCDPLPARLAGHQVVPLPGR